MAGVCRWVRTKEGWTWDLALINFPWLMGSVKKVGTYWGALLAPRSWSSWTSSLSNFWFQAFLPVKMERKMMPWSCLCFLFLCPYQRPWLRPWSRDFCRRWTCTRLRWQCSRQVWPRPRRRGLREREMFSCWEHDSNWTELGHVPFGL